MKRKHVVTTLIILAFGISAYAVMYDAGFSVPVVNGTANAGPNPPQGAIVYDTSSGTFQGNTVVPSGGSPNWVALSSSTGSVVVSGGTERVERAYISGSCPASGNCTITHQSSAAITSVAHGASGSGQYTINFASGTFSGPPSCVITSIEIPFIFTDPTSTQFYFTTYNTSGSTMDATGISIICEGPQ